MGRCFTLVPYRYWGSTRCSFYFVHSYDLYGLDLSIFTASVNSAQTVEKFSLKYSLDYEAGLAMQNIPSYMTPPNKNFLIEKTKVRVSKTAHDFAPFPINCASGKRVFWKYCLVAKLIL